MESHRTHLVCPTMTCDNVCEMLSTVKTHYRLNSQDFFNGSQSHRPPCLVLIKIQTPRNKGGLRHKFCFSTDSLGRVSHSHFLRMVGTFLKSRFPDISQGPALQAGFPKDDGLRPAMSALICTFPRAFTYRIWRKSDFLQERVCFSVPTCVTKSSELVRR